MKRHSVFAWLVLALCAALLMVACERQETEETPTEEAAAEETPAPVEEEPAPEGLLLQEPISPDIVLDPALYSDEDSLLVDSYIYEGLVGLDGGGNVVPALAMSWTISEDELDYIFYLRPEVVFHDGTELNADVVVANFNRWFDPEDPLHGTGAYADWEAIFLGFRGEYVDESGTIYTREECPEGCTARASFDGIEKVDDLTVLIHLNRVDPELFPNLALPQFSIASLAALEAAGEDYGTQGNAVGTGAYYIDTWTDEHIILLPNPDYWGEQPEAGLEFPFR
jgi:peptide/nickel transport system substrate-binding protein